jgi:hypothetical protein
MTQSEVPRWMKPRHGREFRPGHFRLGRLNEAAGVCGGRGTYGYSIDLETFWDRGFAAGAGVGALPCGQNGGINGPGSLNRTRFAPNGAGPHQYGHTCNGHAEARCRFETEYQLRSVNERLPVDRSPADLLSGEFLDDHHGTAAARAKPSWGRLCLAASRRRRGLLWTAFQQLLAEG